MAVPVFEGEKWRRLDSNLNLRYQWRRNRSGRRTVAAVAALAATLFGREVGQAASSLSFAVTRVHF